MKTYQSYKNLPPLAGLCSMQQGMVPGLSIETCVARLKRYHYAFKRLHQIFTARLTAEPIYELKMGFSYHSHLCAEHVAALRKRVGEMREPPLGLDAVPDQNLEIFFDEILAAPSTEELILGLYEKALPALQRALENHLRDTNRLVDAPSVRICRFALLEVEDMIEYGKKVIDCLVHNRSRQGNEVHSEKSAIRNPQLIGSPYLIIASLPLATLMARKKNPPQQFHAFIPPSLTSMKKFPGATNVFPIPTTWASTPKFFSTTKPCRPTSRC